MASQPGGGTSVRFWLPAAPVRSGKYRRTLQALWWVGFLFTMGKRTAFRVPLLVAFTGAYLIADYWARKQRQAGR